MIKSKNKKMDIRIIKSRLWWDYVSNKHHQK